MQQPTGAPALKVQSWTGPGSLSRTALRADAGPLVLGIATPDTSIRDTARELARAALRDALGALLGRPPHEVRLISRPGYPIELDHPGPRVGLSISHEPGFSLAAIHTGKAIGIDLMRVDRLPDWLSDWEKVARDYLGPKTTACIARQPRDEQVLLFARAWTRLEASLKCHGMQLQEWSPALEGKLSRCCVLDLDLPDGFIGALAVGPD